MRRFLLFAGDGANPAGGWKDFVESFDTVGQAQLSLPLRGSWAYVFDLQRQELVGEWRRIIENSKLGDAGWVTLDEYRRLCLAYERHR